MIFVLVASLVVPTVAAAATTTVDAATLTAQEAKIIGFLNADRTALGLVPVRVDSRLMAIARARSADMIANDYFSHTLPDGRKVFDILQKNKVPSEYHVLPGIAHYGVYREKFAEATRLAAGWFQTQLKVPPP